VRLCRELGLQMVCWLLPRPALTAAAEARLSSASEGVVFSECFMGENLSILGHTVPLAKLRELDAKPVASHAERDTSTSRSGLRASPFDDPEALDFQVIQDWFLQRFREHGEQLRRKWGRPLSAIEASCQIRLTLAAGADVPILELVPHEPLRGLAATRGAARAYGKPLWGVHTAMGYYRAPTDARTPERLQIAYDLFYAGGASIFSECNMPLRNWGSCSGFFSIAGSPPIREGEQECRGFDDPVCVRAREVLSEFYRFSQFHERPEHGPRVRLGFLLGNLDGWTGAPGDRMWLVDQPGFFAPDALGTWRHFDRAFDTEPWYIPPRKYYWQADPAKPLRHGTPPCGQVDIVPSEAPAEALQEYGALVLLGWNTMTEELHTRLKNYVEQGGTLFLSVPHLSTRTRTDQPQEFLRGGDLRELCGVRILGSGPAVEEVLFAEQTSDDRYAFARGTLYLEPAQLARLDLHGARVLAHPRQKPDQPLLLEHRIGKGTVYLLATWEYPGDRLDAFITDILRALADGQQGDIAVEGRDVFYAVYDGKFPSGQAYSLVYLVNHDSYGQPAYPNLVVRGNRVPVRVTPREMRLVWVVDDLVLAPLDRFVKLTDVDRAADGWQVTVDAVPSTAGAPADTERLVQIARLGGEFGPVHLDSHELPQQRRPEGDTVVRCLLADRAVLRIAAES
ncbi:beta-galactosidase trimerization domain-containing protein, partial [bacterium]|nr:beta-galactosidase trimerization domain-containing protein [bacterium]